MTHPLDALGDAHRRDILRLLRDGGVPVGQLAAALPISRPAVSRHLRILKDAGFVEERAEGTRRVYLLVDAGADAVHAYLDSVWGEATARFRLLAEKPTQPPGDQHE